MSFVQITFDSTHTNKTCMIGIWIETVLYGINCVMYPLCMFILLRERKVPKLRWVLLVMSSILFFLCTAHVGQSLQQLLDVFIYAPVDIPDYSMTYWADFSLPPRVVKSVLFCTLVLAQNAIQIWRLYVVFMYSWRIALVPSILLIASVGCAYVCMIISSLPLDPFYGFIVSRLVIAACLLEATVNVTVSLAIVTRLWRVGRKTASLTACRTNPFASSIYIVIESGSISALFSIMFLAFAVPSVPLALSGLDVLAQLDVLIPLLVVVQVTQTEGHRAHNFDSLRTVIVEENKMTFKPGVPGEQESLQNPLSHDRQCRSPRDVPDVGVS